MKRKLPLAPEELSWVLRQIASQLAAVATEICRYSRDPKWRLRADELKGAAKIARGWARRAAKEAKKEKP
jgi:hypothetical protein